MHCPHGLDGSGEQHLPARVALRVVPEHRKAILAGQLKAWDAIVAELEKDPFMKKTLDSQRAWVERVGFFEIMGGTDLVTAYNHYFPGKLKL